MDRESIELPKRLSGREPARGSGSPSGQADDPAASAGNRETSSSDETCAVK